MSDLTRKQREVLALAVEKGYFHVPRGAGQEAIAEELDISMQAVSERLRRALAVVLEQRFGTSDSGDYEFELSATEHNDGEYWTVTETGSDAEGVGSELHAAVSNYVVRAREASEQKSEVVVA